MSQINTTLIMTAVRVQEKNRSDWEGSWNQRTFIGKPNDGEMLYVYSPPINSLIIVDPIPHEFSYSVHQGMIVELTGKIGKEPKHPKGSKWFGDNVFGGSSIFLK